MLCEIINLFLLLSIKKIKTKYTAINSDINLFINAICELCVCVFLSKVFKNILYVIDHDILLLCDIC